MEPLAATPTRGRDYALVTGAYAALTAGVAGLAGRRREEPAPVSLGEVAVYGAATAGLARLLAKEKVGAWVREPFVDEPPTGERRPRGRGMRYVVGELLTCTRCLGSWSALTLVGARAVLGPRRARVIVTVLALSAANTGLQALLTEVQARSSRQKSAAEREEQLARAAAAAARLLRRWSVRRRRGPAPCAASGPSACARSSAGRPRRGPSPARSPPRRPPRAGARPAAPRGPRRR